MDAEGKVAKYTACNKIGEADKQAEVWLNEEGANIASYGHTS